MFDEIDAQKFYEGLLDLSENCRGGTGGGYQELEIGKEMTEALKELSQDRDNQL